MSKKAFPNFHPARSGNGQFPLAHWELVNEHGFTVESLRMTYGDYDNIEALVEQARQTGLPENDAALAKSILDIEVNDIRVNELSRPATTIMPPHNGGIITAENAYGHWLVCIDGDASDEVRVGFTVMEFITWAFTNTRLRAIDWIPVFQSALKQGMLLNDMAISREQAQIHKALRDAANRPLVAELNLVFGHTG